MKSRFILLVLALTASLLSAESRTTPLDFIILLDKSLSMDKKIEDVKVFVKNQLLDDSLQPGDGLLIILFYGKTEVFIDQVVQTAAEIPALKARIAALKGDGPFTDIGTALDFTYDYVKNHRPAGSRKYFILLTDGRQEAPPGSKYQSLDFSIQHPFLDSAKNIQKAGWKIQILGIGTDTEAENLAKQLSGVSLVLPTSHSLAQVPPPDRNSWLALTAATTTWQPHGGPVLQLDLQAKGQPGQHLLLTGLYLASLPSPTNFLAQPLDIPLPGSGLQRIEIPLSVGLQDFVSNPTQTWFVTFGGQTAFTPGRFETGFTWPWPNLLPISFIILLVFFIFCFILSNASFKKLKLVHPPQLRKAVDVEFSEGN